MGIAEDLGVKKDGVLVPKIIKVIREHYGVMDEKEVVSVDHAVGAIAVLSSVLAAYVTLMCGGASELANESIDDICRVMKKSINKGRPQ